MLKSALCKYCVNTHSTASFMSLVKEMTTLQTRDFRGYNMNRGRQVQTPTPPSDKKPTNTSARLWRLKMDVAKQQEKLHKKETFQQSLLERKGKEQKMEEHIKSYKYLKHIKKKRIKAEMQAHNNKKQNMKMTKILQKLDKELSTLIVEEQRLKQETQTKCVNLAYMNAVVQKSRQFQDLPQFQDLHDVFRLFNTYKQVQEELMVSIEKKTVELEKQKEELRTICHELYHTQVTLEAKIQGLTRELDQVEAEIRQLENEWADMSQAENETNSELYELNLAIFMLSNLIWDVDDDIQKPKTTEATLELLDKIKDFICYLKLIKKHLPKMSPSTLAH